MPLIAHNALPSFQRLREEGQAVLHPNRAARQDIRGLHVGLLNMMPDAALEATERQFFRLVGASNPIAQFYVHPFTLPELPRGETARAHIARYYEDFDQLSEQGLDALIITGANATSNELSEQAFWDPLKRVMAWAEDNVTSTLCSCLATHAVMEFRYGHKRVRQGDKRWGVFSHQVVDQHWPHRSQCLRRLVANVLNDFSAHRLGRRRVCGGRRTRCLRFTCYAHSRCES